MDYLSDKEIPATIITDRELDRCDWKNSYRGMLAGAAVTSAIISVSLGLSELYKELPNFYLATTYISLSSVSLLGFMQECKDLMRNR